MAGFGAAGSTLLVFAVAAALIGSVAVIVSRVLSPPAEQAGHQVRHEPPGGAGMPSPSAGQRGSGVLGVVFAVQLVVLYPWAAAVGGAPVFVLVEGLVLLGATAVGLTWASRGGGHG